ncbi:MAG: chorismate mutase [Gammaproteobacteria bacterium]
MNVHFPPSRKIAALALLALGLGLSGCGQARDAPTALLPLLERLAERNAIGDQVALSKWDSGKPVLDAAREAAVLQSVREQAPAHGLEPEPAARFFAAQIEANKLVQYQLLERWHRMGHAPDRPRPDLAALRTRLDRLQGELLDALARSASLRARPDCASAVAREAAAYARQRRLDDVHRVALGRSLGDFCQ